MTTRALVTVVAVAAAVGLLATGIESAFGAPKPPKTATPSITTGPSGPTSSTSATFTFSGASGATMRCSLDTAAFTTCPTTTSASFTNLGQGTHTFRVTAQQAGKAVSDAATRTWIVDTNPPPAPTITKAPESDDPQTAQFKLTNTEANVTFECSLDGAGFSGCGSTANYNGLAAGDHCFRARSRDAALNASPVREHCWTIVIKQSFGIAGDLSGLLAPGTTLTLDLQLSNPNNVDIRVLDISIDIATSNSLCDEDDMVVLQGGSPAANGQLTFANLIIPRNATRTLSQLSVPASELVSVRFVNTNQNQDACKGNTLTLTYGGTATK